MCCDLDEHREVLVTSLFVWREGSELPGLRVKPDAGVPQRYAEAGGDFNPIHLDEEFALSVGLPGRILHGLWTMAQVARMLTDTAGGPEHLKQLSVQFRDVAQPGHEISVKGVVESVRDGKATVALVAEQSGREVVRNATAEIVL